MKKVERRPAAGSNIECIANIDSHGDLVACGPEMLPIAKRHSGKAFPAERPK